VSYQCRECLGLGDGRSFSYSETLCDNCQPDGTTCGECEAFTFTDDDGNCEECGEEKL
jgi:hypothetical protein